MKAGTCAWSGRLLLAGLLCLAAGGVFACEDGRAASAKPLGGSAGALQRAGMAPSGVADLSPAWRRAPTAASQTVAVVTLDARALRGGVHLKPIALASEDVPAPEAD